MKCQTLRGNQKNDTLKSNCSCDFLSRLLCQSAQDQNPVGLIGCRRSSWRWIFSIARERRSHVSSALRYAHLSHPSTMMQAIMQRGALIKSNYTGAAFQTHTCACFGWKMHFCWAEPSHSFFPPPFIFVGFAPRLSLKAENNAWLIFLTYIPSHIRQLMLLPSSKRPLVMKSLSIPWSDQTTQETKRRSHKPFIPSCTLVGSFSHFYTSSFKRVYPKHASHLRIIWSSII